MKMFVKVSVIVPVCNNRIGIERLLASLSKMSFPLEAREIIVVDNGSTDGTYEYLQSRNDIRLVEEREWMSSYAARNTGILAAKGDILAFTDSDCEVDRLWLEKAVMAMERQNLDIVSGRIARSLPKVVTTADLIDDCLYLRNDLYFKDGVSATANTIVRRECFKKVGLFPGSVRAGGDWIWTSRATQSGLRLGYAADAVVIHPTHGFMDLAKKVFRGGTCYCEVAQALDPSWRYFWIGLKGIVCFKMLSDIRKRTSHPRASFIKQYFLKAWIIFHALNWIKIAGILTGCFGVNRSKKF